MTTSSFNLIEITNETGAITQLNWLQCSERVHRILRPQIPENYVDSMIAVFKDGSRMTIVTHGDQVIGVMVWRIVVNTFLGRSFYVEDLVIDFHMRSQGIGHAMINWAAEKATASNCLALRRICW